MSTRFVDLVSDLATATPPIEPIMHDTLNQHIAMRRNIYTANTSSVSIGSHSHDIEKILREVSLNNQSTEHLSAQKQLCLSKKAVEAKQQTPVNTAKAEGTFQQTLNVAYQELPDEEFRMAILDSVESTYQSRYIITNLYLQKRVRKTNILFWITLSLLFIGTIIFLLGLILSFQNKNLVDIVCIIIGLITVAIGTLIFKLINRKNEELDKTVKELSSITRVRTTIKYIEQITDPNKKDKAIEMLLRTMLSQIKG